MNNVIVEPYNYSYSCKDLSKLVEYKPNLSMNDNFILINGNGGVYYHLSKPIAVKYNYYWGIANSVTLTTLQL